MIGAVDGTHIKLKVPANQHDSYIDRHQTYSINLMGICNAENLFTYVFVGYPGSAHDSRVRIKYKKLKCNGHSFIL